MLFPIASLMESGHLKTVFGCSKEQFEWLNMHVIAKKLHNMSNILSNQWLEFRNSNFHDVFELVENLVETLLLSVPVAGYSLLGSYPVSFNLEILNNGCIHFSSNLVWCSILKHPHKFNFSLIVAEHVHLTRDVLPVFWKSVNCFVVSLLHSLNSLKNLFW